MHHPDRYTRWRLGINVGGWHREVSNRVWQTRTHELTWIHVPTRSLPCFHARVGLLGSLIPQYELRKSHQYSFSDSGPCGFCEGQQFAYIHVEPKRTVIIMFSGQKRQKRNQIVIYRSYATIFEERGHLGIETSVATCARCC